MSDLADEPGEPRRGTLRLGPGGDEEPYFQVWRTSDDPNDGGVILSERDLRWLMTTAIPALLAREAPLPTPAKVAARRADR